MMEIDAKISLKDNMSNILLKNHQQLRKFQREIKNTRVQLQKTAKDKYDITVNTSGMSKAVKAIQTTKAKLKEVENPIWLQMYLNERDAVQKINNFKAKINELRSKVVSQKIQIKDAVSKKIDTIRYKISLLGKTTPVLMVRDLVTKQVAKIKYKMNLLSSYIKAPIITLKDKATIHIAKIKANFRAVKDIIIKPIAFTAMDKASGVISKVMGGIKILSKMVVNPTIKVKDSTSKETNKINKSLKSEDKVITPKVKLKDYASKALSKMGGMLGKLAKGVSIGVNLAKAGAGALLDGAGALIGGALKGGAKLEQQQIGVEQSVRANNKGKSPDKIKQMSNDYMKELKNNANLTPFENSEVISAGSKAINLTGGDTGSAMEMVKLAEDMASLNPEKSLSDAMQAIADMKAGNTEGMQEFGLNISAEDIKKAGGADAAIKNQVAPHFSGGTQKLSQSAGGMVSTIKGNLDTVLSGTGLAIIQQVKPLLEKMVELANNLVPKLQSIGEKLAEGFGVGVQWVIDLIDKSGGIVPLFSGIGSTITSVFNGSGGGVEGFKGAIQSALPIVEGLIKNVCLVFMSILPIISSIWQSVLRIFPIVGQTILNAFNLAQPVINSFKNIIIAAIPIVENIITIFCGVVNTLMPVVSQIFQEIGSKVGEVLDFIGSKMGFIQEVINVAVPIIQDILTVAWSIISPILDIMITVFEAVFETIEFCFPAIQGIIETVWGILKPIFEGIAEAMGWVGDAVDSITGWFGDVFSGLFGKVSSNVTKANGTSKAGASPVPNNNNPYSGNMGNTMLTNTVNNTYVAQTRGVTPSRAMGTGIIAKDNTLINAHEGEKLLTKQEAKQRSKSIHIEKFVGIENANISNEADEDRLVEKMVKKLYKIADITV